MLRSLRLRTVRLAGPARAATVLAAALALVAATPAAPARLWGEDGHRMIARTAVQQLPTAMPGFFTAAVEELEWLNPEPDRWRDAAEQRADGALNGVNAPDHFVDLEHTTPGALRAPTRYAFIDSLRAHGEGGLPGFLPFRITELVQAMRVDFRLWRAAPEGPEKRFLERRILNDAGLLGHYVADGANPHHTTMHHNGWVGPNPEGFATTPDTHWRFENDFVKTHVRQADIAPMVTAPPRVVTPLRDGVLAYLDRSHDQLLRLYRLDKQERFNAATQGSEHVAFTRDRLAAGATMLRDLWWTAWVTSASSGP